MYKHESDDNINGGMLPKKIPQGIVLLEMPMLGCEVKVEVKMEGYFAKTKSCTISIIGCAGDHIDLLFYDTNEGGTEQLDKWCRHIQESKTRSESNMPRLLEQRLAIMSQVKSIHSQRRKVTGRSSVKLTHSCSMRRGCTTSIFADEMERGNYTF